VKADQQPRSHLKLTVELPVAMVKQSYDGALAALKKSADLPGFRKGSKVRQWRLQILFALPFRASLMFCCHCFHVPRWDGASRTSIH